MNYALVTLFFSNTFDKKMFERLKTDLDNSMVNYLGFQRFKEFDQKVLALYQNKGPDKTVADLYPAIISWAAALY